MTLSPLWGAHAQVLKNLLKTLPHALDVGLHLDFTSEFAQSMGFGAGLQEVMLRAFARGYESAHLQSIIENQLDRFESAWGGPPAHIDGHQHVQQFPCIRESLVRIIHRRYTQAGIAVWVRVSRIAPPTFKSRIISAMGANALMRLLLEHRIPCSPSLLGVYGFNSNEEQYAKLFNGWLASAGDVSQSEGLMKARAQEGTTGRSKESTFSAPTLMCHPGMLPTPLDALSSARCTEFAYLSSDRCSADLSAHALRLVRGSDWPTH